MPCVIPLAPGRVDGVETEEVHRCGLEDLRRAIP